MRLKNAYAAGAASAALACGMTLGGGPAMAQSTGSRTLDQATVSELVITAGPRAVEGLISAQTAPKARSMLDQSFISTQNPGQTILQTINLLPGVNFTNNDPYGSAGGDLTLRGFDSQRLALLQDGVPLNDSGNYAVYPSQQLDAELIERVTVNLGTTDVDSPTAAAAGGTIDYVTLKPADDFGGVVEAQAGTENYYRVFGVLQTGRVGPWGTKAWVSGAFGRNDVFTGPGKIQKTQLNARIYQDIGSRGDFVSLTADYNIQRNNFIRRISLAQFQRRRDRGL